MSLKEQLVYCREGIAVKEGSSRNLAKLLLVSRILVPQPCLAAGHWDFVALNKDLLHICF